ncbi:MAG: hypothetical protein JXA54_15895 [Candidatus Heimdallarchaeota archaeon]|nr:hypothetical protein [Candidatus Heimdallarchaeota archaeon]
MKKFNVPILVLVIFYVFSTIMITLIVMNFSSYNKISKAILLIPIGMVTLSLFSLGDFYEWMMLVENRKLRLAVVIISRTVFLISSLAASSGLIIYLVFYFNFNNLVIIDLIGYLFIGLVHITYSILAIISLGYSGTYRTTPDNIYRVQLLASKTVFDKQIEKIDKILDEYALGVTDDLCLIYFSEVVDKIAYPNKDKEYHAIMTGVFSLIFVRSDYLRTYYTKEFLKSIESQGKKTNDLAVIAKPFAILFPEKIEMFKEYITRNFKGKMKKTANRLINEIEMQIPEMSSNSGIIEHIEKLKPLMKDVKEIRALIQDSDDFDIDELMKASNLNKDEIIEISRYLERDVYENKLLTNTKYLAILTKLV